jgi:hypothetical protein
MRTFAPVLFLCALAACQTGPASSDDAAEAEASQAATGPAEVTFFGQSLWAEPVFARDVRLVEQSVAARYALSDSVSFAAPKGALEQGSSQAEIDRLAAEARDGQDLVVVFFTSHGTEGALAVLPPGAGEGFDWTAGEVRDFLAPLEADRQVLILQACHSGSLIPALKHPNRIIITAARGDRSSFGCDPAEDSTWFVRALTEAMSDGGSWEQIFARTRKSVLRYETEQGIPEAERSYPQVSVGAAMEDIWSGENDPGQ